MRFDWRLHPPSARQFGAFLKTFSAVLLACGLGGTYLACSTDLYVGPPAHLKSCDPSNFDSDCIALAGTFCDSDGLCRCANADGSRPAPDEPSDQNYCRGACIPVAECFPDDAGQPDAGQEAGAEAGQDGGLEASVPEPECITAADCPGPPDARCGEAVCEEGVCRLDLLAAPGELVAIASQRAGDCQHVYCDATGSLVVVPDGGDIYNDGEECTLDFCDSGMAINTPFLDGSPCPENGGGYCYAGECVECISWLPGWNNCGKNQDCDFVDCVPIACTMNSECGETCSPCPPGFGCDADADCADGICGPNGMCAFSTCEDGVHNDGETGVDCGAPNCMAQCPDGDGCNLHSDCLSGVCWAGGCQAPTCEDGVQNADETGIDCGGLCAACQAQP